jgi:hypothetical protein
MLVSESDHEDLSEILENVFPNAPEKMKLFLIFLSRQMHPFEYLICETRLLWYAILVAS